MTSTNLKTVDTLQAFIDGNQLAAFAVLDSKVECNTPLITEAKSRG